MTKETHSAHLALCSRSTIAINLIFELFALGFVLEKLVYRRDIDQPRSSCLSLRSRPSLQSMFLGSLTHLSSQHLMFRHPGGVYIFVANPSHP